MGSQASGAGGLIPAALPAAIHLMSHAMLLPRVRIICMPSLSCTTSSALFQCTEFQYWEDTRGMRAMVKYLFSRSKEALAPPLRQLTTAAAGLKAYAADFM